jgi:alpha-amylase
MLSTRPACLYPHSRSARAAMALVLACGGLACAQTGLDPQNWNETPAPMLQWFESPWSAIERKMPDFFIAGYGSVWLPPPSRAYHWPGSANQNSTSVGYDAFDRFDLGKPGAQTAYGTEQYFGAMVREFHLAASEVYIDAVLNHNSGRQTGSGFMQDGGYPGFWMNPPSPMRNKLPTDNWGDFHAGVSGGYLQSENPGGARYCLLQGDLVALIDIDQSSNNFFIRQPTQAGNPQNIPGGTYFNNPNPDNARFYTDPSLGVQTVVNNPGMRFAPANTGGIFSPPCEIPARDEPASQTTFYSFNFDTPHDGLPVAENATGYLMRWTQWMMDVQKVDGFRIDAVKHIPSWWMDSFFDSATHMRRLTPDGRYMNAYTFGECVEGNDFCFDRYVRKPNGRNDPANRSVAGDAFANRDVLDLNGAGFLRNLIGGGGLGSWNGVFSAHIDSTDDGFNNGSVGVNHIFSHDNGSVGDGGANPPMPTYRQQGWYAHAYMLMRTGQSYVYYNARGVNRSGAAFYPRQGVPVSLGQDSASTNPNNVITDLVRLSNWLGRGEFHPRTVDNDVIVFERATRNGSALSGNSLVGVNDRYDPGFDQRTVGTAFPQGTRLVELTGNAANPQVDPGNDIAEVLTVGAGGQVTIRVPRNSSSAGEHHRGYVVYAPAIPAGDLVIAVASGTLAADPPATPAFRRRLAAMPIVTGDTFQIQLTTTNGDSGAANNNNADDNAVFRINQGFEDWNGNGSVDIDHLSPVVPGYEQFVTARSPLANTSNTQGYYAQEIDASRLEEGVNYISVVAFRKRDSFEGPLFREWRTAIYVDRLPPQSQIVSPACPLPEGTTQQTFTIAPQDRTVNRVHLIVNPPNVANPLTLANLGNQAARRDRNEFIAIAGGLLPGENTLLLISFEESGTGGYQFISCNVGEPYCPADFNEDGGVDGTDVEAFFTAWEAGDESADVNFDGGVDGADVETFFAAWEAGGC